MLANPDLAVTLEQFAAQGRDGFYRGPVAAALVRASTEGGGNLTLDDLANYEARLTEPVVLDFRGYQILSAPPPASGPALLLTIMKVLEPDTFDGGPLRTADNIDWIGRVWRHVVPLVQSGIADVPEARFNFEKMIAPESIAALREEALQNTPITFEQEVALWLDDSYTDNAMAATTHFTVIDAAGNIVCATQSLSLHFGAGVVLNDTMSNFAYVEDRNVNYIAPGKRPRSTIAPTMVFRAGRPQFSIGIPGSSRIPTAILQVLLDHLVLHRPLAEAIGDTRIHLTGGQGWNGAESLEAEQSLDPAVVKDLEQRGWKVDLPEAANTGRRFGGINVIELNSDGSYTGYADPRRTNAAVGY